MIPEMALLLRSLSFRRKVRILREEAGAEQIQHAQC